MIKFLIFLYILSILQIAVCETDQYLPDLFMYSDANTDVMLLYSIKPNTFIVFGYGGNKSGYKNCVFKAEGTVEFPYFSGFLKPIKTDIISISFENNTKYEFSGIMQNEFFSVLSSNVYNECGSNYTFNRCYNQIVNKWAIRNKLLVFKNLLDGNIGNDKVLATIKSILSQYPSEKIFKHQLDSIYDNAYIFYLNHNFEASADEVLNFTKAHTLDNSVITEDNIGKVNDLAFFLEQGKKYDEAITILNRVINFAPLRVVAYVNLGDAYYGINSVQNAKESYLKYIDLMKNEGKESKIPKRVFERVK